MLKTLTATSAPPALQAACTALDNLLNEISVQADLQAEPLAPRTLERTQQFDAAAKAAHVVSRLVRGHALERGMVALAGQVHFSASDFKRGRFARRLQAMRQVHAAAQTHAAELVAVGLTPEAIADLGAQVDAAEIALGASRNNIAARTVATANLNRLFTALARLLEYTLDPLMDVQRRTDPDAYTRYLTARRVIDRPGVTSVGDASAAPAGGDAAAAAPQPLAA